MTTPPTAGGAPWPARVGAFGVSPIEHECGELQRWLLVRRSVTGREDRAYYLCMVSSDISRHDPAIAAGQRWAIETCLQTVGQEAGLDEY